MSQSDRALDPEGLVSFEHEGERYTAYFGFRAMKAVERHYELPFMEALQRAMPQLSADAAGDKAKIAEAAASIRLTEIGRLFEFALLKHHPKVSEDDVEAMIDGLGFGRVSAIIAEAISAALVQEGEGEAAANPPRGRRKS